VGICIRAHENNGVVFVTGVGRSNDIPNAPISSSPNYVYVNETNNDMKKIAPENLLTKAPNARTSREYREYRV
jgi:hypothetical protein